MTGEVSLFGEVTGVGGLPFKIKAAVKAGRKLVLIPTENARDLSQVPDDVLSQTGGGSGANDPRGACASA